MLLTPVAAPDFDVEFDIAYASHDNFTGQPVYRRPACFLNPEAAECLRRAIGLAAALGLRFRVFDAFRPSEAQWALWRHTPDPEFLADPRRGSPHSRGAAVDLTLIDGDGRALEMGTGFDNFTPRARHGDTNPVVGIAQDTTTGSGINATFDLTFEGYKFFQAQPHDGLQCLGSPAQKSGDGGVTNTVGDVMLRSRIGVAQTNMYDAGLGSILWACDRNFTANANVLVPIYVGCMFDFQSDTRLGVVAQVPDIFRVNMRDFSPEQTITVQGEDYKIFPVVNNDANNTIDGEGYSGFEGLAYRVETGPVV